MQLRVWALLALVACAYARTAQRQPSVSAHITSLTDKDNRHKAMVHPAFASAGRQAGVEVWRIQNFEPVPVPQKEFGKFYKGDSYIVLKTTSDKRNNLSWDIHYWIGSESTQDEAGAAAILTVGLDDKFDGKAVQHRETLGHESPQFAGYFQPAIRYLDGGHASGFKHVTTNAGATKRLFQIKGKRNVRVRQVDPLIASMNKGDCFILDVDHDIYVYVGERSRNVERLKAISVANQVRDQDHNGRGRVEIIDQYSSETDVQKFFTALGSGSRDTVPDESAGGDDQTFEKSEEQSVTLSEISDSSGKLKITPLSKPYMQEQLKPQECYVLDTVSGSIYVWVGKQSTEKEKSEAMTKAQQYLTAKNYPSWVHVARIPQGTEPAVFKQYFQTWRDVGMSHSRIVRSLSDEGFYSSDSDISEERARMLSTTGTARYFTPDNADRPYTVYRIENMKPVKAYDSSTSGTERGKRFGELFQGDSYIIHYGYNGRSGRRQVVYFWLGKDSTQDEKVAAALGADDIDESVNGKAVLVRVPQGEEPTHLMRIFRGRLVTLSGGRNTYQGDSYDTDGVRLFRIYGTTARVDMRADQVPEETSSLQADDVFLLETPEKVYLWFGQGSSDVERKEAVHFVHKILGATATYEEVKQGEEPTEFWSKLGGEPSQIRSEQQPEREGKPVGVAPRLYEATLSADNTASFKDIADFKQNDLDEDEVNILDAGEKVYVWLGKETTERLRKSAQQIADAFLRTHRTAATPVMVIKQGMEPELFTKLFQDWDPDMWKKQRNHDDHEVDSNEIDVDK